MYLDFSAYLLAFNRDYVFVTIFIRFHQISKHSPEVDGTNFKVLNPVSHSVPLLLCSL
jgi:hypothetical protein